MSTSDPAASPMATGVLDALAVDDVVAVVAGFAEALGAHREVINRLNVYPVPDGDTGTNMSLTVTSVLQEVEGAEAGLVAVCGAISHGSLMGARGNSGVILSQILRGVAGTIAELGDGGAVDASTLSSALTAASVAADQAVMRPVEGTILTVMREIARGAATAATDGATLVDVLEAGLAAGETALERTPEQLPVLAEAGVVDAGGAGLLLLLHAALRVIDGRPVPDPPDDAPVVDLASLERPDSHDDHDSVSDLRYEVMFFLEADDDRVPAFKDAWAVVGDSIVVVGGDGLWNCHVHTNDIGAAIEAGVDAGRPRQIRVSDLFAEVIEEQMRTGAVADPVDDRPRVQCAIVAVSPADGISRIFDSLGVQELVTGGQTMNPSTAEVLAAVERAPSDEVVILPNNSNIIAVAQRVDAETSKTVKVVPTRSVPEGFASLLGYDPSADADANADGMAEIAADVLVGEVTQAVRDTSSDAGPVREGDWIGLDRHGIKAIAGNAEDAAIALLEAKITASHEILTLIEGEGASEAGTLQVTDWLAEHRPGIEVELHRGGQPHYPYLFGIE